MILKVTAENVDEYLAKLMEKDEDTGRAGERKAADYLVSEKGYRILARNWRRPEDQRDELDLVCLDGEILVFVEVKTRSIHSKVRGYHAVDARKKKAIKRCILSYIKGLRPQHRPKTLRFDVVEVMMEYNGRADLAHFENVELFHKRFKCC